MKDPIVPIEKASEEMVKLFVEMGILYVGSGGYHVVEEQSGIEQFAKCQE